MAEHFVIAGAQRSATSWLARTLARHPAIAMAQPMRPEPKYFLRDGPLDAEAYRREFFGGAGTAALLGEKSTSYIEHPAAAARIAAVLPGARVLFLLRDPVERAISNWRFSVANGYEPLGLEAALAAEPRRLREAASSGTSVSPHAYVARGRYADYLGAWRDAFAGDRMAVLTTEATAGREDAVRHLFAWLGVDPDVPLPGLGEAVNASTTPADVPPAARQALREAFADANRALADAFGVDTGAWQ